MDKKQKHRLKRAKKKQSARAAGSGPDIGMMVRMSAVLSPVEEMLREIEDNGTVDEVEGVPCFQVFKDGVYYETHLAIISVTDLFEHWAKMKGMELKTEKLNYLARCLKHEREFDLETVQEARRELSTIQAKASRMTYAEGQALLRWVDGKRAKASLLAALEQLKAPVEANQA